MWDVGRNGVWRGVGVCWYDRWEMMRWREGGVGVGQEVLVGEVGGGIRKGRWVVNGD